MWRTTAPHLWHTVRQQRRSIAIVALGGFMAGSIVTLKSLIESRIIQLVADAVDERSTRDVWSTPLGDLGTVDGDWVSSTVSSALPDLNLSGGVALYVIISILAAAVAVVTTSSRQSLSRGMFNSLYAGGLRSAFANLTPGSKPNEPGGLAGSIQQGAQSVAGAYAFLVEAAQYVFGLATVVLVLSNVSIKFALCCLFLAATFAAISWIQGSQLSQRREAYDERRLSLFALTDDVIDNRDVLLAHEKEDLYIERLSESTNELASIDKALSVRERAYDGAVNVLQDVGQIAILGLVLVAAARGAEVERVGEAYFYVSIFARLMWPIRGLLSGYDDVRRSMSSSKTLVSLLAAQPVAGEDRATERTANTPPQYAAQFSDVDFSYPSGKRALRSCSFAIPQGGVTLILGRSGSGKTTIARMLLGFLSADAGAIEILGRPQGGWDKRELLRQMSYLAQTNHVVEGSVAENLFVSEDSDVGDMSTALVKAGLASTGVEAQSLLDYNARTLSEGQKQRLALARIFADRAPIVVLDEPLAGVDAFTFSEVRYHLADWLQDPQRTAVVISHRLALASAATHVVVLGDHGEVVEEGDPRTLEATSGGTFASLLNVARAELQPHRS